MKKQLIIEILKKWAGEEILAAHPDYKQRNGAMGLLDPLEYASMKSDIQNSRTKFNGYEEQINASDENALKALWQSICASEGKEDFVNAI